MHEGSRNAIGRPPSFYGVSEACLNRLVPDQRRYTVQGPNLMNGNSEHRMRVFISHGKQDTWIAGQIASEIRGRGATSFLDETDIPAGGDFKRLIHEEIENCDELIALFTPWSAQRFWVWVEVGAAWVQQKRIVAVLYGITIPDLEKLGGSKAILEDINVIELNQFDRYLGQLKQRADGHANA